MVEVKVRKRNKWDMSMKYAASFSNSSNIKGIFHGNIIDSSLGSLPRTCRGSFLVKEGCMAQPFYLASLVSSVRMYFWSFYGHWELQGLSEALETWTLSIHRTSTVGAHSFLESGHISRVQVPIFLNCCYCVCTPVLSLTVRPCANFSRLPYHTTGFGNTGSYHIQRAFPPCGTVPAIQLLLTEDLVDHWVLNEETAWLIY